MMLFRSFLLIFILFPIAHNFECPNRELIEQSFLNAHIPGGTIIVVDSKTILYEQSFGHHSFSPSKSINVNKSIFTLASISKTFISIAIMQLVESKHLDLDQDINKYLNKPIFHPHYPSHPITLRQLLSHTASINADIGLHLNSIQSNDIGLEKINLEDLCFNYLNPNGSNWLEYPPGNVTLYSNEGTALAALIIERVSNMSYEKYIKEKIIKPLNININTTGFRLSDIENLDELVEHYTYAYNSSDFQQWKEALPQLNITKIMNNYPSLLHIPFFSFPAYPAGLLRMTTYDLSKFLRMFMNNGYPLINSNSINEIKKVVGNGQIPQYNSNNDSFPPSVQFGLIWNWRIMNNSRRFIGQRGTNFGATHLMMINEQNTIGIIILTNGDMTLSNQFSTKVYDTLTDIQIMLFDCFEEKNIHNSSNNRKSISFIQLFLIYIFVLVF